MNEQTILYMAVTDVDQLIRQLPITSSVLQIVCNQLSQEQKKQPINCYALLYWYYCFTRLRDFYLQRAEQQPPGPEDYYQSSVGLSGIMNCSCCFATKYPTSTGFDSRCCFSPIVQRIPFPNYCHSSQSALQIHLETESPLCVLLRTRVVTFRLCRWFLRPCILLLLCRTLLSIRERLLP